MKPFKGGYLIKKIENSVTKWNVFRNILAFRKTKKLVQIYCQKNSIQNTLIF